MATLRFRFSGFIKEQVMRFYGIPFSRFQLEPALVPFLRQNHPITLVDVGASEGFFAAAVDSHCGIRRAVLIEPQRASCERLRRRFAGDRFAIECAAAAAACGTSEMAILNFHYSSSLLTPSPEVVGDSDDFHIKERIIVPTATVDSILQRQRWDEHVDLLKIDVQGTELDVLTGARDTLALARMVWTEVSFRPLYQGSSVFEDIYDFMRAHSFRLCALQEGFRIADGELLQADALFCATVGKSK